MRNKTPLPSRLVVSWCLAGFFLAVLPGLSASHYTQRDEIGRWHYLVGRRYYNAPLNVDSLLQRQGPLHGCPHRFRCPVIAQPAARQFVSARTLQQTGYSSGILPRVDTVSLAQPWREVYPEPFQTGASECDT